MNKDYDDGCRDLPKTQLSGRAARPTDRLIKINMQTLKEAQNDRHKAFGRG